MGIKSATCMIHLWSWQYKSYFATKQVCGENCINKINSQFVCFFVCFLFVCLFDLFVCLFGFFMEVFLPPLSVAVSKNRELFLFIIQPFWGKFQTLLNTLFIQKGKMKQGKNNRGLVPNLVEIGQVVL